MTARAPAPADTSSTHKSLAAAHARLAARDDAILRAQIAIAQIAAPTGEEHERGGWVARRFRDCGLTDIETDDAGNVVGPPTRNATTSRRSSSARISTRYSRAAPTSRFVAMAIG